MKNLPHRVVPELFKKAPETHQEPNLEPFWVKLIAKLRGHIPGAK